MSRTIDRFTGANAWLSNFAPAPVVLDGETYPTVEHAYQAAKFRETAIRDKLRKLPSPGSAKQQARLWPITIPGWDERRLAVMADLLTQKFDQQRYARRLLDTGDARLIEGNHWGDEFWGVCNDRGENHLGRLLMEQRARLGGTGVIEPVPAIDLNADLGDFDQDLDDLADLGIDFDTPQEGPWYFHHPESDCVWQETDWREAENVLEDGLVIEIDETEYHRLNGRSEAHDFDLEGGL